MRELSASPVSVRWFRDQLQELERLRQFTGSSLNDLLRRAVDLGIARLTARERAARRARTKKRRRVVA